ncbi:SIP domain-containing protein [Psychrobacter sp. NZS113]|uniref:SIP domain-containing protein n=1 Tax=Psychrobacter sp. NZS113 TaxID=2792045 RepID=UPI0018CDADA8|nr:SIP domain-containing protein [Psychrobacter sp. NZS113]MBH0095329.1 SIP domain-containing protein [Psychrobacter sp. NZS113]
MMPSTLAATNERPIQENGYTPLDLPELPSTVAHINEEHFDELLGFLKAFTSLTTDEMDNADIQLTDIYAEGIALRVQPNDSAHPRANVQNTAAQDHNFFIPFTASIAQLSELQTQYILLKQRADKKLGKKTIKLTEQRFTVQDSYLVSKNMLRLILTSPESNTSNPIPVHEAGYAYLFDLEHNVTDEHDRPSRSHCYYTLRKAWSTSDGMQAWVDVFLHGDTSGGNWARSLQAGDSVISKREFPEKVEHLHEGQALLVADETSMPTVARLLELWDNPLPPLVLCITQDKGDQSYFNDVKIGTDNISSDTDNKFTVLPLVTGQVNAGKELATLIDNTVGDYLATHPLKIDKVWGALEAGAAKSLRRLLKQRLTLERADAVVKVYWRKD